MLAKYDQDHGVFVPLRLMHLEQKDFPRLYIEADEAADLLLTLDSWVSAPSHAAF